VTTTAETTQPLEIPVVQRGERRPVAVLVVVRTGAAACAPAAEDGATLAA